MKKYAILLDDGVGGRILEYKGVHYIKEEALKICRETAEVVKNSMVLHGKSAYVYERNGENGKEVVVSWNIGSKIYSNLYRVVELK